MVVVVKMVRPSVTSGAARTASSMAPAVSAHLMSSAASSPALRWAVGGWSFFIAENYVLSENRARIIARLGEDGYHYAYGACSTAAVSGILYGYVGKVRGVGPFRWTGTAIPARWKAAGFAVQGLGAVLASQTLPTLQIPLAYGSEETSSTTASNTVTSTVPTPPTASKWKVRCPFDFADAASKTSTLTSDASDDFRPRGLDRVTRHPGLWSFGLLFAGHALLVPSVPQAAWSAMPLLVALIGGAHQDARHRRGSGGTLSPSQDLTTSNVPFLALAMGTQGAGAATDLVTKEVKVLNAAVALSAVGLWVAARGRGGVGTMKNGLASALTMTRRSV